MFMWWASGCICTGPVPLLSENAHTASAAITMTRGRSLWKIPVKSPPTPNLA